MLMTLGRGAARLNHARRNARCGKPPGGIAAGHVVVPAAAPTMELMRAAIAALAALGYALVAALGVSLAAGDGPEVGWILVGPLPFCVVRPRFGAPIPGTAALASAC